MTAATLPTDDLGELAERLGFEVRRTRLLSPIRAVYLSGSDFASLLVADDLAADSPEQARVVKCAGCLSTFGSRRPRGALIVAR